MKGCLKSFLSLLLSLTLILSTAIAPNRSWAGDGVIGTRVRLSKGQTAHVNPIQALPNHIFSAAEIVGHPEILLENGDKHEYLRLLLQPTEAISEQQHNTAILTNIDPNVA